QRCPGLPGSPDEGLAGTADAVDHDLALPVASPQVLLVALLDALATDQVAGPVASLARRQRGAVDLPEVAQEGRSLRSVPVEAAAARHHLELRVLEAQRAQPRDLLAPQLPGQQTGAERRLGPGRGPL